MAAGKATEARRRKGKPEPSTVDRTYLALIREFPLRPIRTEEECARATVVMDRLADRGEEDLAPGEADYLDVLATLVEQWEDVHVRIASHATPAEELRGYMDARNLSQADVAKAAGVSESTISELLNGKRSLGKRPAGRLAGFFRVPIDVFLD